jgi:hypothetical protein
MRTLKAICIVFCLLSVVSVLTGIRSFHWSTSDGLNITRQGGLINTLWSVFSSLLYATAAYAIHRRIPVVWKLATFRRKIECSKRTNRLHRPCTSACMFNFCRSTRLRRESWRAQLQARFTARQRPI